MFYYLKRFRIWAYFSLDVCLLLKEAEGCSWPRAARPESSLSPCVTGAALLPGAGFIFHTFHACSTPQTCPFSGMTDPVPVIPTPAPPLQPCSFSNRGCTFCLGAGWGTRLGQVGFLLWRDHCRHARERMDGTRYQVHPRGEWGVLLNRHHGPPGLSLTQGLPNKPKLLPG